MDQNTGLGRTDRVVEQISEASVSLSIGQLLSADQEMIPARNEINGDTQDFVVADELLLLIRKAFAHCTLTRHTTRNARCFQSVIIVQPVAPTNSSPPAPR